MARSKTEESKTEGFFLSSSPSHLLHRAEQLAADRFAKLVGDSLTLRQFAVLAAIAEAPGLSQVDLVRATGVDRSTLADMVGRMEQRGWVTRAASPLDGRAHAVTLAPAGTAALAAATHHARAADAAIMDALPRTKRHTFLTILAKLAKFADALAAKEEREARRQAKRQAREKSKQRKQKKRESESRQSA
jgi:DNA-binding MarR family transcriptional regulator